MFHRSYYHKVGPNIGFYLCLIGLALCFLQAMFWVSLMSFPLFKSLSKPWNFMRSRYIEISQGCDSVHGHCHLLVLRFDESVYHILYRVSGKTLLHQVPGMGWSNSLYLPMVWAATENSKAVVHPWQVIDINVPKSISDTTDQRQILGLMCQ